MDLHSELMKAVNSGVKLERLSISEVSGVGDPANEIPGWLVMKDRARQNPDVYLKNLEAVLKGLRGNERLKARRWIYDVLAKFRELMDAEAETQRVAAILPWADSPIQKAGRIVSSANMDELREAIARIQAVLDAEELKRPLVDVQGD
jgi:hypothetical protein